VAEVGEQAGGADAAHARRQPPRGGAVAQIVLDAARRLGRGHGLQAGGLRLHGMLAIVHHRRLRMPAVERADHAGPSPRRA
jgi:hypothetical protein